MQAGTQIDPSLLRRRTCLGVIKRGSAGVSGCGEAGEQLFEIGSLVIDAR
jgi:hypothetical protein